MQQQTLKPLASSWVTLTEAHKRKWLAVSKNYPSLPPEGQATMHSRMSEWAALSPQQRTEARARQNSVYDYYQGVDTACTQLLQCKHPKVLFATVL